MDEVTDMVDALRGAGALREAAEALYAAIPTVTRPRTLDVGVGVHLVVLPGYGPLSNVSDFVFLAWDE